MNPDDLQTCADVLGKMADSFAAMPDNKKEAVTAALHCMYARSLVLDYSLSLAEGLEPFDAMEATINGDRKTSESERDLMKAIHPIIQ